MKKFLLAIFILTFLLSSPAFIKAEEMFPALSVDFKIATKDLSISIDNLFVLEADVVTNSKVFNLSNLDLFTASLIDTKGVELSSTQFNFIPPELIADYPGDKPDSLVQNIKLQYNNKSAKLVVKRRGSEVFTYDLTPFCNRDNTQNNKENYLSCPSDVKPYAKDGICNYKPGKEKPDPDCPANVDYDARDNSQVLSEIWGTQVKLKEGGEKTKSKNKSNFIVISAVGGSIIFTLIIGGFFIWRKRKLQNQPSQPPPTIPPPIISPPVGQQPPPIQNQRSGDTGYQWQPPGLVNMIVDIIGNIFKRIVGIFK